MTDDSRLDILTNALVGPLRAGEPGACRPSRLCERDDCERAVSPYGSCSAWPEFIAAKISGAAMEYARSAEIKPPHDENAALRSIIADTLWMARRYADKRMTYAVGMYNDAARKALALSAVTPHPQEGIWAIDGMDGDRPAFSGLSDEEYAAAKVQAPIIHGRDPQVRIDELLRSNNELLERARKAEGERLDWMRLGARAMRRAAEAACGNHAEGAMEDSMTSAGLSRNDRLKLAGEADAAEAIRKDIAKKVEDSAFGYAAYMGEDADQAILKLLGVTSDWLHRRANGDPSRAELSRGETP